MTNSQKSISRLLNRILKSALISCGALCALLIAALIYYDLAVFQPARTSALATVALSNPEDRDPPVLVREYLKASNDLSVFNIARLMLRSAPTNQLSSAASWQLEFLLFTWLTALHISEDQAVSIVCVLSFNGSSRGVSDLAQKMYSRPLSKLSDENIASVVAVLASPSYYLSNQQALLQRASHLQNLVGKNTRKKTELNQIQHQATL